MGAFYPDLLRPDGTKTFRGRELLTATATMDQWSGEPMPDSWGGKAAIKSRLTDRAVFAELALCGMAAASGSDARVGYDKAGKQFKAHVYVFALQTATKHSDYDVLDLTQWTFYVVPRAVLESRGNSSISLSALERLAYARPVGALKAAVVEAFEGHSSES